MHTPHDTFNTHTHNTHAHRLQKEDDGELSAVNGTKIRPLYDTPYMLEAREFLRKKLIGKKVSYCKLPFANDIFSFFSAPPIVPQVNIQVDYIKPAQDRYPERIFCTVKTVMGDKTEGV